MDELTHLLLKTPCTGGFTHLRLSAPQLAARLQAGQEVEWGENRYPVMRSNAQQGWIELLIKGEVPSTLQISGPLGEALSLDRDACRFLLMGNLDQLPRLIFAVDTLRQQPTKQLFVLLQADDELPFRPAPCRTMLPGIPAGVIATLPLLNDWGVRVRIASQGELPGCYEGEIAQLAELWLETQTEPVEVIYC